jgi:hypothetical protein
MSFWICFVYWRGNEQLLDVLDCAHVTLQSLVPGIVADLFFIHEHATMTSMSVFPLSINILDC